MYAMYVKPLVEKKTKSQYKGLALIVLSLMLLFLHMLFWGLLVLQVGLTLYFYPAIYNRFLSGLAPNQRAGLLIAAFSPILFFQIPELSIALLFAGVGSMLSPAIYYLVAKVGKLALMTFGAMFYVLFVIVAMIGILYFAGELLF